MKLVKLVYILNLVNMSYFADCWDLNLGSARSRPRDKNLSAGTFSGM